ncbi:hypothetical protein BGZ83_011297 [Gryganskiella cystojenkinii]|nr:hypothetical protein BGZ83_011297 [Gryganskiella cystojenkinii]
MSTQDHIMDRFLNSSTTAGLQFSPFDPKINQGPPNEPMPSLTTNSTLVPPEQPFSHQPKFRIRNFGPGSHGLSPLLPLGVITDFLIGTPNFDVALTYLAKARLDVLHLARATAIRSSEVLEEITEINLTDSGTMRRYTALSLQVSVAYSEMIQKIIVVLESSQVNFAFLDRNPSPDASLHPKMVLLNKMRALVRSISDLMDFAESLKVLTVTEAEIVARALAMDHWIKNARPGQELTQCRGWYAGIPVEVFENEFVPAATPAPKIRSGHSFVRCFESRSRRVDAEAATAAAATPIPVRSYKIWSKTVAGRLDSQASRTGLGCGTIRWVTPYFLLIEEHLAFNRGFLFDGLNNKRTKVKELLSRFKFRFLATFSAGCWSKMILTKKDFQQTQKHALQILECEELLIRQMTALQFQPLAHATSFESHLYDPVGNVKKLKVDNLDALNAMIRLMSEVIEFVESLKEVRCS